MNLERYMSPAEHVLYVTRRHLWVLAQDIGIILLTTVALLLIPNPFVGFIALLVLIRFAWKAVDWFYDRLILTNQRIMGISGLLTRRVASMPLSMMTDLTYQRTLLGRLLGFGTLRVESAGQQQSLSRINHIAKDVEFYQKLAATLHPPKGPTSVTAEQYADEAMALVQRGRPTTIWDPDDTNPNLLVLP